MSNVMAPNATTAPLRRRKRLDILMIVVDDLRTDLGSYGRPWARTPNIDKLASRSVAFLQAHAAVANCAPSRASLLTGLRPDTHGVLDLTTHVRDHHPSLTTLPQAFRRAGYLAVSYGKLFHQFLDDAPSWSGQDEFEDGHVYRGKRGKEWARAGGWTKGWSYNEYHSVQHKAVQAQVAQRRRRGDYKVGINAALPPYEVGPDAADGRADTRASYTDERIASQGIRALRRLRAQSRRWLLALGFVRPHLPFNSPARYWSSARAAGAESSTSTMDARPLSHVSALTAAHLRCGDGELYDFGGPRRVRASSSQGRQLALGYAAAVSFVDAQVGRVVTALRRLRADNTTLLVLLSDHGWKLGHHGGWGKHTLMAADTCMPLLAATHHPNPDPTPHNEPLTRPTTWSPTQARATPLRRAGLRAKARACARRAHRRLPHPHRPLRHRTCAGRRWTAATRRPLTRAADAPPPCAHAHRQCHRFLAVACLQAARMHGLRSAHSRLAADPVDGGEAP